MDQAEWEFVCLLPLFDPPRHDTKETIERCREKGIDVKMVTGDQLLIGKETSRQLGMGTDMYSTEALLEVRHCALSFPFVASPYFLSFLPLLLTLSAAIFEQGLQAITGHFAAATFASAPGGLWQQRRKAAPHSIRVCCSVHSS